MFKAKDIVRQPNVFPFFNIFKPGKQFTTLYIEFYNKQRLLSYNWDVRKTIQVYSLEDEYLPENKRQVEFYTGLKFVATEEINEKLNLISESHLNVIFREPEGVEVERKFNIVTNLIETLLGSSYSYTIGNQGLRNRAWDRGTLLRYLPEAPQGFEMFPKAKQDAINKERNEQLKTWQKENGRDIDLLLKAIRDFYIEYIKYFGGSVTVEHKAFADLNLLEGKEIPLGI